ncbi:MAG: hypothetical protein HQK94_16650 [Nitrospirae bacterium]|nr:hypothetical protein [Nitrospirota bacterium]
MGSTGAQKKGQFIEGFTDEVRERWLKLLYEETASSFNKKNRLIFKNWAGRWKTQCFEKHTEIKDYDYENCSSCEWAKIYKSRHYTHDVLEFLKKTNKICHENCILKKINYFSDFTEEEEDFKAGLWILLDFFNVWLWFLDELTGTIYFPEGAEPAGNNTIATDFIRKMELPLGKGSTGYALRISKGLCIADTLTDPRGGVAIEDIVARNFSYLAVPVRENKEDPSSKIIAYIALSYPVPYAWHRKEDDCQCINSDITYCFYKKFKYFVGVEEKNKEQTENKDFWEKLFGEEQPIAKRVRNLYEAIMSKRLSREIEVVSVLGTERGETDDGSSIDWDKFLYKLSSDDSTADQDALGINYASLWRYKDKNLKLLGEKIVKNVENEHNSKLVVRAFRNAYMDGFHSDLLDRYKEIKNIKIETGIKYLELKIVCESELSPSLTKEIENTIIQRKDEIENRILYALRLTEVVLYIYENAHFLIKQLDSTILDSTIKEMITLRLFDSFTSHIFEKWCKGTSNNLRGTIEAAFCYWTKTGEISKEKLKDLEAFFVINNKKPLIDELAEHIKEPFSICMWLNLEGLMENELKKDNKTNLKFTLRPYRLAYKKDSDPPKPYKIIGYSKKEKAYDFIERNIHSYDTYKVLDALVNFGKEVNTSTEQRVCSSDA